MQTETPMKINLIPIKKLALLSAAFCAATMLAFSPNASALTIGDDHELGTILPGIPTGDADITNYVNIMIGLGLGDSTTVGVPPNDNLITRSMHDFGPLPTAVLLLRHSAQSPPVPADGTIDLGAGGVYTYLFAKYDGPNQGSEVWFVGDLSGIITIPLEWNGYGLSGWALFGPGVGVPDGGTTVMLLGAALGALGMARRFLKS